MVNGGRESVTTLHSQTLILCTVTEIRTAGDSSKEMSAHVTQRTTQVTATSNTFFLFTDNSNDRLHKQSKLVPLI
jgi:hypothetical protein